MSRVRPPEDFGAELPGESFDEFLVIERSYCDDDALTSVGLANIQPLVPGIEENKDKILRAATRFKESGVNLAVFPELCISGYFWEDEEACRPYMEQALLDNHTDWIEHELRPLLDEEFRGIVLNGLTDAGEGRYANSTFILGPSNSYLGSEQSYRKVFLPGIEKTYCESGRDDRLVVEGKHARLGFTTCYDYLFGELLREYSVLDEVDAMIEVASWRAAATRDYPGMNVRTDLYYGRLWEMVMAASSAMNQVWTIACNAVGRHGISDVAFWGGSGIWAPSGMPLLQASNINEELLIVHNLDLKETRAAELDDFDYAFDFSLVYRPTKTARSFTRTLD